MASFAAKLVGVFVALTGVWFMEVAAEASIRYHDTGSQSSIFMGGSSVRLLKEALEAAFGTELYETRFEARVDKLEGQLATMYAALPKNKQGRLDAVTVKYALHRHFVRQHSLYIQGLEPLGGTWNATTKLEVLEAHAPRQVCDLFERQLEQGGLDLRALGLLAATVEVFVHQDAGNFLKKAYNVTGLSPHGPLNFNQSTYVVNTFLIFFLRVATDDELRKPGVLQRVHNLVLVKYPDWKGFQAFLQRKRHDFFGEAAESRSWSFADVTRLAFSLIDGLGPQQVDECGSMVKHLAQWEIPGTGRLRYSDFYDGNLYSEGPKLLANLGALDPEALADVTADPLIIIMNYVASSSNCVAASTVFAVCCPDLCDGLLEALELQIRAPSGSPELIRSLVEALPSRHVAAPRVLPEYMANRLREIAEVHGGQVPLHSRMFAQWLHHAYPLECKFPFKLGTTTPVWSGEWFLQQRHSLVLTREEAAKIRNASRVKDLEGGDLASTMPWLTEELAFAQEPRSAASDVEVLCRAVVFCLVVFASAHKMLRQAFPAMGETPKVANMVIC